MTQESRPVRLTRLPQPVSNCLSPFSSHFTCPQGQHYRVWCWLLVTLLITQGAARLKNLTRLMPRRLYYWTVLRMVKAGYWDASALFDQMAMAALLTLPPPACPTLYLIADKTTQQKSGKKMPLAHKTRMNEFAPYVFGLDLVLLVAQWGRFRIPVACELIDPKIKGHQNILFRQMLRRHHLTAAGLMTFESLLGAHSFCFRLNSVNLCDRIEHTTALNWKGSLNIDELPPRVSQTLRLDRFLLAAPIRRQRVSHLDWSAQLRAPILQQFVNVFARVTTAVSVERDCW